MASKAADSEPRFKEAYQELCQIIDQLETGDLALALFEGAR